jgi:hypothetical protein
MNGDPSRAAPDSSVTVATPGASFEDAGVEGDPVDDGGDQTRLGEHCAPLAEGRVARQADTCSFLPLGDDLKEQFGSAGVDLDVAELIKQQQVEAARSVRPPGRECVAVPTRK